MKKKIKMRRLEQLSISDLEIKLRAEIKIYEQYKELHNRYFILKYKPPLDLSISVETHDYVQKIINKIKWYEIQNNTLRRLLTNYQILEKYADEK